MKVLKDHKEANKQDIIETVLNSSIEEKTAVLMQLRDQVWVYDAILDFKEFLSSEIEEVKDEV